MFTRNIIKHNLKKEFLFLNHNIILKNSGFRNGGFVFTRSAGGPLPRWPPLFPKTVQWSLRRTTKASRINTSNTEIMHVIKVETL